MPSITVTATALGAFPLNIGWLMTGKKPDGSTYAPANVVVTGQASGNMTNVQWVNINHDPTSTANYLYVGDSDVTAAHKGLIIPRGDYREPFPATGNAIHLADKYVNFDTAGATSAVFNLDWEIY